MFCIHIYVPNTLLIHISQGISLQPSLSSSKGTDLLSSGRHDIQAQHSFLWKTWGRFTCRSLRNSYTTNYAFKPRIIVPEHLSRHLTNVSFVPIKDNRILLFAKYYTRGRRAPDYYLHLSIHEIRSDHRVGPALWSFNGSIDGYLSILDLELIKSTENALGITFWTKFDNHWKLFDISTTETDASDNFPLIESGRVGFNLMFKLENLSRGLSKILMQLCWTCSDVLQVILSPDRCILLNVDSKDNRHSDTIDVHY